MEILIFPNQLKQSLPPPTPQPIPCVAPAPPHPPHRPPTLFGLYWPHTHLPTFHRPPHPTLLSYTCPIHKQPIRLVLPTPPWEDKEQRYLCKTISSHFLDIRHWERGHEMVNVSLLYTQWSHFVRPFRTFLSHSVATLDLITIER